MTVIPARYLADIELTEESFRADFDITDRYQAFSAELVRLSLLGIAAYGFLVSDGVLKEPNQPWLHAMLGQWNAFATGAACLAGSAALALAHRFFSTGCLNRQLRILRLLKRLENTSAPLSAAERQAITDELAQHRAEQPATQRTCRRLVSSSAVLLIVGIGAATVGFGGALRRSASEIAVHPTDAALSARASR